MKRFSAAAIAIMAILLAGADARLGEADKAAAKKPAPAVKAAPAASAAAAGAAAAVAKPAAPVAAAPATPVAAGVDAANVVAAEAPAAPAWEPPVMPEKLDLAKKCEAIADVKLETMGQNMWEDEKKMTSVQRYYRLTNTGAKAICGLEMAVSTNMEVASGYGGVMKAAKGTLITSWPAEEGAKLNADGMMDFGFILSGPNGQNGVGDACVTKLTYCKEEAPVAAAAAVAYADAAAAPAAVDAAAPVAAPAPVAKKPATPAKEAPAKKAAPVK